MSIRRDQLTDRLLKMIPKEQREALGAAGVTFDEAAAKETARNERELQGRVIDYLRLHEIEPIVNRFGSKTTTNRGCPDIVFAVNGSEGVVAVCWEFKFPPNKLSADQVSFMGKLTTKPNNWRYRVISGFEQARKELREMGVI